jgi:hypothetical protein
VLDLHFLQMVAMSDMTCHVPEQLTRCLLKGS